MRLSGIWSVLLDADSSAYNHLNYCLSSNSLVICGSASWATNSLGWRQPLGKRGLWRSRVLIDGNLREYVLCIQQAACDDISVVIKERADYRAHIQPQCRSGYGRSSPTELCEATDPGRLPFRWGMMEDRSVPIFVWLGQSGHRRFVLID